MHGAVMLKTVVYNYYSRGRRYFSMHTGVPFYNLIHIQSIEYNNGNQDQHLKKIVYWKKSLNKNFDAFVCWAMLILLPFRLRLMSFYCLWKLLSCWLCLWLCYRCEDDSLPNIKWVLDLARAAVLRHGVRGLVIDPYNEIDHQRSANQWVFSTSVILS